LSGTQEEAEIDRDALLFSLEPVQSSLLFPECSRIANANLSVVSVNFNTTLYGKAKPHFLAYGSVLSGTQEEAEIDNDALLFTIRLSAILPAFS
jgi:hypothetical protein